jgi:hypothetical protein
VTPFHAALVDIRPDARDAWVNEQLGLDEIPADGPALPAGCVPYLPCSVDALLRVAEHVGSRDVFVDVGCGVGRAMAVVHLLTNAQCIGIEVQPQLAHAARELFSRLDLSRAAVVEGDAAHLAELDLVGDVFFLYCPFSGARLTTLLADLASTARTRPIRICAVDLPLPKCAWLTLEHTSADLDVYRSG